MCMLPTDSYWICALAPKVSLQARTQRPRTKAGGQLLGFSSDGFRRISGLFDSVLGATVQIRRDFCKTLNPAALTSDLNSDGADFWRNSESSQVGELVSMSNKDLLELEEGASALEKRLLVCKNGEDSWRARCSNGGELLNTFPIPQSNVLGRIKAFLPTFDKANQELFSDIQERGAEEFNIEALTDPDQRYVEMDLAVGIADLHTPEAVAAAELAASGHVLKRVGSDECDQCSTDSESDGDNDLSMQDVGELLETMRQTSTCKFSFPNQEEGKEKAQVKRKMIELL